MKITNKILENIIREELAKLVKEEGYMPGADGPGAIAHKSLDDLEIEDKAFSDVYKSIQRLDDAMSGEVALIWAAFKKLGVERSGGGFFE